MGMLSLSAGTWCKVVSISSVRTTVRITSTFYKVFVASDRASSHLTGAPDLPTTVNPASAVLASQTCMLGAASSRRPRSPSWPSTGRSDMWAVQRGRAIHNIASKALIREAHHARASDGMDSSGVGVGASEPDTPIARLLQKATPVSEISFEGSSLDYDITHRELVELFGLQPRHLRVFTQQRSLTGIFPYEDMVVFKFEHLKGLLFWDRIMVFDSDRPSVQAFMEHLRSSVRRNNLVAEHRSIHQKQPFELVALECMLDELAVYYESAFGRLHHLIALQLDKIILETGDEVREDCLYKLLPLEHKINSLQVRQ